MDFVVKMLSLGRRELAQTPFPQATGAWLNRCARNHALNFERALRPQRRLCLPLDRVPGLAQIPASAPSPEVQLCYTQLGQRLEAALSQLPSSTRRLFLSHHVGERTLGELAAEAGKTRNALDQTFFRARRRLRVLLEAQGWTESQMRSFLVPTHAPASALHRRGLTDNFRRSP
jgi:RNA polymerase sigma factor (sigma-70 family)